MLAYHGCDEAVAQRLIAGERFKPSKNAHDWLGGGVYFWETNPLRGLDFAREVKARNGSIKTPAVVGTVIDLRLCLDLGSSSGIREVKGAYDALTTTAKAAGVALRPNEGGQDLLRRFLDRAVIEHLHEIRKSKELPAVDTVRGLFLEGSQIYAGAGFFEKTHVQICVRNLACIHGVFRVPEADLAEG